MKKIKKLYKAAVLMVAIIFALGNSSCTDFLTIYPTNSTIHENYWKTAADVNGMLATCYKTLQGEGAVQRMIIWGELRADNIIPTTNADNKLKYIVEANMLPNNDYCKWGDFYKAINYCNMVLLYAPLVLEEDPDFTIGDLRVVEGEMYALRALCHFYLLRTFRDIPLAMTAMVDDSQPIHYPQVHPMVVLDTIMNDLKKAEGYVMRSGAFPMNKDIYNCGRITRNAVRSIMADVNLWKASFAQYYQIESSDSITDLGNINDYYTACIVNCDSVLNSMEEYFKKEYLMGSTSSMYGPGTKNPYYLISNMSSSSGGSSMKSSYAYDRIFGMKSSWESIFELQFMGGEYNKGVSSLYGHNKTSGSFRVPKYMTSTTVNTGVFKATDLRLYSFIDVPPTGSPADEKADFNIAKYVAESSPLYSTMDYRSENSDANWIVYRKTDVMLMKAQALILRNQSNRDLETAFDLIKGVNFRSLSVEGDSLSYSNYSSADALETLVLEERLRELTYEGKRWYDLVQKALRDGTTKNILTLVVKKLDSNSGAVQSKMASMNTLFFPIAESEIKLNKLLKQNPAYEGSSSIIPK